MSSYNESAARNSSSSVGGRPNAANSAGKTNEVISAIRPSSMREHVERQRPVLRLARRAQVAGDRRLPVGAGRRRRAARRTPGRSPCADAVRIASRPSNQVGCGGIVRRASSRSSAASAVDVGALVGVHVAAQQLALLVARLAPPRAHSVRRSPGRRSRSVARARWSALFTDGDARLEQRRRVLGRPAEHVAQDQHRPLSRRQVLDRGEERELDRLARDDDGAGLVLRRRGRLEQPVGVGLQPRELGGRPTAGGRVGRRRRPAAASPGGACCAARRGTRWSRSGRARPETTKRPSAPKLARARQARRNVSWTRSSASSSEPSIR